MVGAGKSVRLKFKMKDADLFALRFVQLLSDKFRGETAVKTL